MSSKPMTGAVVFAKNIARVAKFYEEMMSMSVVHADGDHVVLESACVQLVVHGIPKRIADTIEIADPPEIREKTPIKLFFPVPSLAEARTKAPRWAERWVRGQRSGKRVVSGPAMATTRKAMCCSFVRMRPDPCRARTRYRCTLIGQETD